MEFVTIENVAKLLALIVSVIVAFGKFNDITVSKKSKLRADYEFSEKIIAGGKWKEMPDFLLEKGYLAINGKALRASEIRFILNTSDSMSKFDLYEQAQFYLTIAEHQDGVREIAFKNVYKSTKIRNVKISSSTLYFVTAFIAAIPVFFVVDIIKLFGLNGFWGVVVFSTPFSLLAYGKVREYWNICAAERIVNEKWKELS
ncbi:conserved membrane hypothetical protein [Vibrio crassostreae]|jgi:hypothetical protein|nr:hypothetical protein BK411_17575 [Vibrio splendidus]CAK1821083.1 conserved membrane hypothetical protein [Vibrio crassostreae]CAK1828200.1 conserved membrane hypothetical protein [Vibrio crassostreae]CAK2708959.1 conserved membrane hypothetical protein [Vibrio crassostreae]CAK3190170.1 conserved membrane hypothetical protein [Vibrio crassostreae]